MNKAFLTQKSDHPISLKFTLRLLIAVFMISAGIAHFARPENFLKIMPPAIPFAGELVYISGFFEILGGVGLLIMKFRTMAGWGLIALLVAVFPVNIYMAIYSVSPAATPLPDWALWARLPLQFVLMAWVYWAANLSSKFSKNFFRQTPQL